MATHICLQCGWKDDAKDIKEHIEKHPECRKHVVKVGSERYPHGTWRPTEQPTKKKTDKLQIKA